VLNDDNAAIRYHGAWQHSVGRKYGDIDGDVHATEAAEASAELTFTGAGIELISEKCSDHGAMDVTLDGQLKQTVDLALHNFPRLSQVVVFRAYGLPAGRHTIKVVNKGQGFGIIDAFRVYGLPNSQP